MPLDQANHCGLHTCEAVEITMRVCTSINIFPVAFEEEINPCSTPTVESPIQCTVHNLYTRDPGIDDVGLVPTIPAYYQALQKWHGIVGVCGNG